MDEIKQLQAKYNITAFFYDVLDYPWEQQYKHWRPGLLQDIHGQVLEAGVGTGRNLKYYQPDVELTGIDLSAQMVRRAKKRVKSASCKVKLLVENVTAMQSIRSEQFDWVVTTFLCCVLPDKLQPLAIKQFGRVLKPGGRLRLLEIIYSKNPKLRRRQEFFAPFVKKLYGAAFDRHTLEYLQKSPEFEITSTYFLKADTHLVIEARRIKS